jgi:hypothetical protein
MSDVSQKDKMAMNTISNSNAAAMLQLPATLPLRGNALSEVGQAGAGHSTNSAERTPRLAELSASPLLKGKGTDELREKFTEFVGEAFYGQMFKAMRSTVGKPAYFHGGRAEEVFQGQLDQTMAEQLTKTTASKFAEPMFARQFPRLAESGSASSELGQLTQLRRR